VYCHVPTGSWQPNVSCFHAGFAAPAVSAYHSRVVVTADQPSYCLTGSWQLSISCFHAGFAAAQHMSPAGRHPVAMTVVRPP
jgi:hypothetical protein